VKSSHAYRDPLLGARARLEARRHEAASGEARLTPSFLARLPMKLQTELAELRAACEEAVSEELESLARAEGLLAAYCAALKDTIAREPAVDAAYRAMPDSVPDPPPRTQPKVGLWWSPEDEAELSSMVNDLTAQLRRAHADVRVVKTGVLSRIVRFRADGSGAAGAPFSLRLELPGEARPFCFLLTLATSVPRAMPRLLLRPEGFLEGLFRSFGVRQHEVGDLAFDGLFVIDGPASSARLLTPAVRAALLELAFFDIPRLVVEGGVATLAFSFDPTPACIGAAVRALLRVRSLPL
jgi:hypothetical protein